MKLKGFSLVELLLVLSIFLVLISLLLPSLQNAREYARETSCRHHLARLSEASIRHEYLVGYYPSGGWSPEWLGVVSRSSDGSQPGGWAFNLLSYLDARRVREIASYSHDTTNNGKGNTKTLDITIHNLYIQLANNSLSVFNCPSRRSSHPIRVDTSIGFKNPASSPLYLKTASRSDYAGNGGSTGACPPLGWFSGRAVSAAVIAQANSRIKKIEICHTPNGNPTNGNTHNLPYHSVFDEGHSNHPYDTLGGCETCYKSIDDTIFNPSSLDEGDAWVISPIEIRFALPDMGIPDLQDGIFQRMAVIRSGHIIDGMTGTYMIGEKYIHVGKYQSGLDSGDKMILISGYSSSNIRWGFEQPRQDTFDEHPNAYGSAHYDGFNMAFSDGRVIMIGYDIDPIVHKSLSSRNDASIK